MEHVQELGRRFGIEAALNVALVLAGARPAYRLDAEDVVFDKDTLRAFVAFVRERMGLGVVYNGEDFDEPLVFDTRAVAASESLTAHVAAWKDMFARPRESDQTRRAYAAHRELLGYPRAAWDIEDGAAARGTSLIVLRAVMLGPGGAVDVMRFACRRARVSEAVEQLRRHFVAAAEAVVGRDVTGEGDVLCSFRWEASGAL